MPRIEMPMATLIGHSGAAGVWNPLTRALSSAEFKDVRIRAWFSAPLGSIDVKPAFQFSDDGVNWTDTQAAMMASWTTITAQGWEFFDGAYTDLFPASPSWTPRLMVRFGLTIKSTGGRTSVRTKVVVEAKPTVSNTRVAGPRLVNTDGSANYLFTALTGAVSLQEMAELRATLELVADSNLFAAIAGYQVTDEPWDPSTWEDGSGNTGDFVQLDGITRTTPGIAFGTSFVNVVTAAQDFSYVRFGVGAKNESGTGFEAGTVQLRIDSRA